MPHLRLIGLILFITSLFIALAAAVTKTESIRVKNPDNQAGAWPPVADPPESGSADTAEEGTPGISFRSVPIIWPLLLAGGLGLILWFAPTAGGFSGGNAKSARKRRSRRKRR